jgi:hypothetical protein
MNDTCCIYCTCLDELNINQFISHYINLGFNHIFIREDLNSKFNIQYFIDKKYLSLITILKYETGSQGSDAKYFIDNILSKNNYEYCFFIDADEFLYLKNYDTIQEFLSDGYNEYDTIGFRWILFGHGFIENQSIYDSIIDTFQYSNSVVSYSSQEPPSPTMKCLIKSKILIDHIIWDNKIQNYISADSIYHDYIHFEHRAHHPNSKSIILPDNLDPTKADIFLAHYITQSLNYYLTRKFNRVRNGSWKNDGKEDTSREVYKTQNKYIFSIFTESNLILNNKMIEKYGNISKKIDKYDSSYFLFPFIDTYPDTYGKFLKINDENRNKIYKSLGIPDQFEYNIYLICNEDIIKEIPIHALSENAIEAYALSHFINNGSKEGRIYNLNKLPSNFDWKKYLSLNSDLKKGEITNEIKAKVHYLRYGILESRHYCDETP